MRMLPGTRRPTALAVGATLLVVVVGCGADDDLGVDDGGTASAAADTERGAELWTTNCAVCHGPAGEGTTIGPPLVHEIYEPGHHSDESFQVAVAEGVPQHHWEFGPMPALPGLDRADVADITAYVRELQREAGIIE
jgi:mono/diheme cytochrome c family protein